MTKEYLKDILKFLKKNGIQKGAVAKELAVTQGYLSDILGGRKALTSEIEDGFKSSYGKYIIDFEKVRHNAPEKGEKGEYEGPSAIAKGEKYDEPTAMQIFHLLAKTLDSHGRILESIESKMAQEQTQAMIVKSVERIDSNLIETLTGVEFVSKMQLQPMLDLLKKGGADKKDHAKDAGKKSDETNGDGHKSGIKT